MTNSHGPLEPYDLSDIPDRFLLGLPDLTRRAPGLLPPEQRWLLTETDRRDWAVLWHSPDGPIVSTPTSRAIAEKELTEAATWHDPDGNDPPPPGDLELIWRPVGPWHSEKRVQRVHIGPTGERSDA